MVSLTMQTVWFIEDSIKVFYKKAIDNGAKLGLVVKGNLPNTYVVTLGNAELTYLGTSDGKAQIIGVKGEIF